MRTRTKSPPKAAKPMPFKNNSQLIEAARSLFEMRKALGDMQRRSDAGEVKHEKAKAAENLATTHFHASLKLAGASCHLAHQLNKYRLGRTELEIVLLLILDRMALLEDKLSDCADVLSCLRPGGRNTLSAVRCVSDSSRLIKKRIITYDDPDEDFRARKLEIDPGLVEIALEGVSAGRGWPVTSEKELYRHMSRLTQSLMKRSETLLDTIRGFAHRGQGEFFKTSRNTLRLLEGLLKTLDLHKQWKLGRVMDEHGIRLMANDGKIRKISHYGEGVIFLALLGKELAHVTHDDALFTGAGLARAVSDGIGDVLDNMYLVRPGNTMMREGIIQPCGGRHEMLTGTNDELSETEFELTPQILEELGIARNHKMKDGNLARVRPASLTMDQLVLPPTVASALDMAAAQMAGAKTLMHSWGLGDVLPYGKAVTLLFWGPPGTGKTACAEALSHRLGKPILVASYAEIQNCLVGATEKNIMKIFKQARDSDAVLFWDEADAMFFDRDSASQNWEVRDINVLLQQIEAFEGVCILATNRKVVLDKALERRISLKVEFPLPDRGMRKRIWEKLVSRKMPVERKPDYEALSAFELSGGEIKNAVLNAARMALTRSSAGPVTEADFQKAVRMEQEGRWATPKGQRLGF